MKKDKYSHNTMIKKTKKLSKKERKYCSCIMKVRSRLKNRNPRSPYAICTYSLYNRKNLKRTKRIECSQYYNFNLYSVAHLREFAKEKKIKITKNGKPKKKALLLKDIQGYIKKLKGN